MTDVNKDKLLYVPKIAPEKHFESEGKFKDKSTDIIKNTPKQTPIVNNIIDDLKEAKSLIDFLPPDLIFIKDIIDKIIEEQEFVDNIPSDNEPSDNTNNEVNNDSENPIPDLTPPDELIPDTSNDKNDYNPSPINPTEPNNNPNNIDTNNDSSIDTEESVNIKDGDLIDLPDFFPGSTNITINFTAPKTLVKIAQEDYKRDTLDLNEYYLQKLRIVLLQYFQEMLSIAQECGIIDIRDLIKDFDGESVQISNSNLIHLKDYIIRSQINRDQRTRLFKLTHNVDNTLAHIRSWYVSEQTRERYYTESYLDSGTYLDNCSNLLLAKNKSYYDNRYKQNLYNMFKYLDSSVVVTGEILSMITKEAQAKGKLLKEGINIFVSKETIKQEKINKQAQSLEDTANKQTEETNKTSNTSINNESEPNNNEEQKEHNNQQEEEIKNNTLDSNNEVNNILDAISAKNTDNLFGSFIETLKSTNNK